MLSHLLPERADNSYRGHKLALWLFGVVVLMRIAMSLNTIFNGYYVAVRADGIPLDAYPAPAAQTAVAMFALLGLAQLMICMVCIIVLVRYRTLVPLMFTVLAVHYLAGRMILRFLPIVRTGTPPGLFVNLTLLALMIVGLVLSLHTSVGAGEQKSGASP